MIETNMFDASLTRYSKVFPCTQYQQICKIKLTKQKKNFPSRKLYNNITSIVLCLLRFCRKTRIHLLDRRIVRKQLDIMPTYHYVKNQGKLIMQYLENG